jgi:hypothetical protein
LTLVLALLSSSPLAADALYDVGSNTTFASFNAAFIQVKNDQSGPFAVTARVRVLDGVYSGGFDLDAGLYALQPQPGAGLVIEADPNLASASLVGSGAYGIRLSGVANVSVRGLRVQGFSVSSLLLRSAANASFSQLSLEGAGASAVDALDCPGLVIDGCNLAPSAGTGIVVDQCDGAVLQGNRLQAGSSPSYGLVAQNSTGVQMDGNRADGANYAFNVFSCNNVTVVANVAIFRGSKQRGLVVDSSPGTLVLKNLLVGQVVGVELQSSTHCALYQNTVWEHSTAGLYVNAGSSDLVVKNNLWQGFFAYVVNAAAQATLTSNFNGFRFDATLVSGVSSYNDLPAWQGAGFDAGSRDADPVFAVLAASDPEGFKLTGGSPLLGYGTDLYSVYTTDYFGNHLSPAPAIWDPGIHVYSAPQNTPTVTPTATPVLPPPTPTRSPTPSVTMTFTPSPVGTATPSPSATLTATITPTYTVTPYPFQRDRVITYPNPWSPAGAPLSIVYEPAANVSVRLFDMAGELVADLPGSDLQPDLGFAKWDGRDRDGARVPSGLYFCVVNSTKGVKFTRFTVLY